MIKQSKGRIFLAEQRDKIETTSYRSFDTFSSIKNVGEKRFSFGSLYRLGDDTLAARASLTIKGDEESYLVIIPVVGALVINNYSADERIISAGELLVISMDRYSTLEIINPYDKELVNYLHLWFKKQDNEMAQGVTSFSLDEHLNELIPVNPYPETDSFRISIGKFGGRHETTLQAKTNRHSAFVYAIEGAFEVNGRLLQARDGLALWQATELEAEALSNNAILLIAELVL